MAKNVNSTQFRTVDVDAYDEEAYEDEAKEQADSGVAEVTERAGKVKELLSQMKTKEALVEALKNPPVGRDQTVKSQNYDTVMWVLKSFKGSDIDGAVAELSMVEVDILMKYLYKGFSCSPDKAANLLLWHEKVVAKGGLGSIVRVMVDRKGV